MIIHRSMPWISGFMPTALSVSMESDAPMKNRVSVRAFLASPLMNSPIMMPVSLRLSR